jgi:hypothetical protein
MAVITGYATPVHVIQALLGHASPDTVMIYAKLYPGHLIEEYRKTVRPTRPSGNLAIAELRTHLAIERVREYSPPPKANASEFDPNR